jgi:hypothetical protein
MPINDHYTNLQRKVKEWEADPQRKKESMMQDLRTSPDIPWSDIETIEKTRREWKNIKDSGKWKDLTETKSKKSDCVCISICNIDICLCLCVIERFMTRELWKRGRKCPKTMMDVIRKYSIPSDIAVEIRQLLKSRVEQAILLHLKTGLSTTMKSSGRQS